MNVISYQGSTNTILRQDFLLKVAANQGALIENDDSLGAAYAPGQSDAHQFDLQINSICKLQPRDELRKPDFSMRQIPVGVA